MDSLTFITGNLGKAELVSRYLHFPVTHKSLDLVEIQSLDLATIIEYKAKEAYRLIQSPVLVDDTSLRFYALGRLPGPLVKWFLSELDINGLCRLLDAYTNRSAQAEVMFGYYDGKHFATFANAQEGTIASEPRGSNGFGWDPIFIPRGFKKTWAEMTVEEQAASSLRKTALEKLAVYLHEQRA